MNDFQNKSTSSSDRAKVDNNTRDNKHDGASPMLHQNTRDNTTEKASQMFHHNTRDKTNDNSRDSTNDGASPMLGNQGRRPFHHNTRPKEEEIIYKIFQETSVKQVCNVILLREYFFTRIKVHENNVCQKNWL